MKKIFTCLALLCVLSAVHSQSRLTGQSKAPDLRIKEWIPAPPAAQTPRLVEFFHSASPVALERIAALQALALEHPALSVVLVARQSAPVMREILPPDAAFYTGIDGDGSAFAAYGVQFVPFAVWIDARGRVQWFGNPETLTPAQIETLLK